MQREAPGETSPIIAAYQALQAICPNWYVEIGQPGGTGWLRGIDLRTASTGPFNTLLSQIGASLHTTDRRTIAASFALRYGWSSGVAIAPYILCQCVPHITLDNVSVKFNQQALFERVALRTFHRASGRTLKKHPLDTHSKE
jgi:hypothetical protein